jgi:hypothetical protein
VAEELVASNGIPTFDIDPERFATTAPEWLNHVTPMPVD